MEAIKLTDYQRKALSFIETSLLTGEREIYIELPAGCGKSIVLAKTIETLNKIYSEKILVVTNTLVIKQKLINRLFETYADCFNIAREKIEVETLHRLLKNKSSELKSYHYVIFYDVVLTEDTYEAFACKDKSIITLSTFGNAFVSDSPVRKKGVVFIYSFKDAVMDGVITPAMDLTALQPATQAYGKHLLQQFGFSEVADSPTEQYGMSLFLDNKKNYKLWVEYITYKSQVVSPAAANSLLKDILLLRKKQNISNDDIVLAMVFSTIPSLQKDEVFKRYRIIVWDIENLVFYSNRAPTLFNQLSQITYFPIDHIGGKLSHEAEMARLSVVIAEPEILATAEKESLEISEFIQRLRMCKPGEKHAREYEEICTKIIRNLFETNYFNRLTDQHRTDDKHFRMDLIGSLKNSQTNSESIHPLWQMFVQHYNSHFIVFEFKNYKDAIDQNLIYITEKYLFDAALRNVAIIISRKGFSDSAKFAAEGCLKEHRKLILSLSDDDLIQMLQLKSDKAADYLLDKLEEFLMRISK